MVIVGSWSQWPKIGAGYMETRGKLIKSNTQYNKTHKKEKSFEKWCYWGSSEMQFWLTNMLQVYFPNAKQAEFQYVTVPNLLLSIKPYGEILYMLR